MCQLKSHLSGLGMGQAKRAGRESLTLSTALSMLHVPLSSLIYIPSH